MPLHWHDLAGCVRLSKCDCLVQGELNCGNNNDGSEFRHEYVKREDLCQNPEAQRAHGQPDHSNDVEGRETHPNPVARPKIEVAVQEEIVGYPRRYTQEIGQLIVDAGKRDESGINEKIERRASAADKTVERKLPKAPDKSGHTGIRIYNYESHRGFPSICFILM